MCDVYVLVHQSASYVFERKCTISDHRCHPAVHDVGVHPYTYCIRAVCTLITPLKAVTVDPRNTHGSQRERKREREDKKMRRDKMTGGQNVRRTAAAAAASTKNALVSFMKRRIHNSTLLAFYCRCEMHFIASLPVRRSHTNGRASALTHSECMARTI